MSGKYRFIPDFEPEEIAQKQLDGLKWTVSHTAENSPFYALRYKEKSIEPGDIKSLDDINRKLPLPLLKIERRYHYRFCLFLRNRSSDHMAQAVQPVSVRFYHIPKKILKRGKICSPAVMN